jgi:hypothetical protein
VPELFVGRPQPHFLKGAENLPPNPPAFSTELFSKSDIFSKSVNPPSTHHNPPQKDHNFTTKNHPEKSRFPKTPLRNKGKSTENLPPPPSKKRT